MKKIGLTGGIGSGKSYIAQIFEALRVPVFYADDEAKAILNQIEVQKEVSQVLKTQITHEHNGLPNREKIAQIVFSDTKKLKDLNAIIHPKTEQRFKEWCSVHSGKKYVLKEAAILFESGSYKELDGVICVIAPMELRLKRIIERDKKTEVEIRKRILNQWSDEQRIAHSQWVISNTPEDTLLNQVLKIHQEISILD